MTADRYFDQHVTAVEDTSRYRTATHVLSGRGIDEEEGVHWPLAYYFIGNAPTSRSISHIKEKYPDVATFVASGQTITASKALLRVRSSYFNVLLDPCSGFWESIQDKPNYEVPESYGTMKFITYYVETEPDHVDWSDFYPDGGRGNIENNLDCLLNILYAADKFLMADLHSEVQRQIMVRGGDFICTINALEIKFIADEANARDVACYCEEFLKLNPSFTLFPCLPLALRRYIWGIAISQPCEVSATNYVGAHIAPRTHISGLLWACKESRQEVELEYIKYQSLQSGLTLGRGPSNLSSPELSLAYFHFEADVLFLNCEAYLVILEWLEEYGSTIREVRYLACYFPEPYDSWEDVCATIVLLCPHLKILYLKPMRGVRFDKDEQMRVCRERTNKTPTTLAEAQRWLEEHFREGIRVSLGLKGPFADRDLPKVRVGKINEDTSDKLRLLSLRPGVIYGDRGIVRVVKEDQRKFYRSKKGQLVEVQKTTGSSC
ncbi:hypothetical protein V500_05304 [Pseudogymnoascus sp. VKM F-4518 (FW-2643)]|nr:hypothetical protein V500_05304 [Pseudogymnoascus sp. VKM F-4518 (FW-2643)]